MATELNKIEYFKDSSGRSPFLEWLEKLKDQKGRAKVRIQIDRLERGNFGRCRSLGGGLHESKINYGPGYRVYFGMAGSHVIIVLGGGTKKGQSADIKTAMGNWSYLKEMTRYEKET